MHNLLRLPLIITSMLLLCSCAMTSSPGLSGSATDNAAHADEGAGKKPAIDTVFNDKQEITPAQSIEKDGLLVSYSMQTVPAKSGNLLRLSLVFRNMQNRGRSVWTNILLVDANGQRVKHYSKNGFIRASSHMTGKSGKNSITGIQDHGKHANAKRIEWANTYWLKSNYKIPPNGIAVGELVYYYAQLNLPMTLTVRLNKQEFVFTTRHSLPTASQQP
ncbi:MAG: hypothetical protein GC139_00885 [Sideroxydans sp.]|nr:hypothetical protein [Sideroxydans sp.]